MAINKCSWFNVITGWRTSKVNQEGDMTEHQKTVTPQTNTDCTKLLEAPEIDQQKSDLPNNGLYYLSRGILWGCVVTTTAVISACLGAAVTTIEPVDREVRKALADRWQISLNNPQFYPQNSIKAVPLTRPIDLLLVEIEPSQPAPERSPHAFVGRSNRILLLQFQPQQPSVKLINIPTDSRVRIPGMGWNTITNANRYGGVPLVTQAVSQMNRGVTVDRYVRATPEVFAKFTSALELKSSSCQATDDDCTANSATIQQQQLFFEAFRQNLQHPKFIAEFSEKIQTTRRNLDTNLSSEEITTLASFVGQLKPEQISVTFPANYTQYKEESALKPGIPDFTDYNYLSLQNDTSDIDSQSLALSTIEGYSHPFHHLRIAVQNTTDRPELGMQVVSYLMKHNFQNVSLIEHMPLQLEKTEILLSSSDLKSANYLQRVLGLGRLQLADSTSNSALVIRIGEDAQYLTIEDSFLR
ncbi:MAG: LCP family protein [Pleurocapsa sp.]